MDSILGRVDPQPPIVDISGLAEGDAAALRRVARDLVAPAAEWGVFHVVGHGISTAAFGRFENAMRAFFALPAAAKAGVRRTRDNARGYYDEELTKNQPDWKEVFDYGAARDAGDRDAAHSDGTNQWPEALPGFREALLEHYHACEGVGLALLRALCASFGVATETLDAAFEGHTSFVRLNHYARCPDPAPADAGLFPEQGRLGVYHHTDAGALTLLYQDEVAGLQVRLGDRFITIEPVAGALAVNLGDMLQVWSNDRVRSPLHRVIASAERERYSAPFFLNPAYGVTCEPLPALVTADAGAHYRPISWAHFRDQRSAGDYADYGREIQIADFRTEGAGGEPSSASTRTRRSGAT